MEINDRFLEAVKKLREAESSRNKKVNFDQTIDLIVNLKEFDVRKEAFNIFIQVPYKIKDTKVVGFFEKNNNLNEIIKKDDFGRYKEKKDIKKLVRDYDFFISNAKLMPAVATAFGRVLGPVGKMPSPQLGIVSSEDENVVKEVLDKINTNIRIRVKESSIKVGVAKASLDDDKIVENVIAVYEKILETLPRKIDNVKNIKIKFTMGKPVDVSLR